MEGLLSTGPTRLVVVVSPTVPLSHCHTVPLSDCPTVALSHCPTVPLSHCLTVPLPNCPTVPLFHCLTVPLSHCLNVPMSRCHTVSLSHCPTVERCCIGRNANGRACTGIGNVINVRIPRLLVLTMALSISLITTLWENEGGFMFQHVCSTTTQLPLA